MRALSIAVFLAILSISLSAFREAYGYTPLNTNMDITTNDIKEAGSVAKDPLGFIISIPKYVGLLWRVLKGAALLGSTIQALSPLPLPSSLVGGLNLVGTIVIMLAVVQFVRGIGFRTSS